MSIKAIYAGSFDPITLGHFDIIQRASKLVDELTVAVGNNPAKRYLFDLHQRESHVRSVCGTIENVNVVSFSGLLIHA